MNYEFDNNIPIYMQIINVIKFQIISKKVLPGEKLLSIREYSKNFSVNPNTVQKALMGLENDKLIYTERTNGKFITKDIEIINNMRQTIAKQKIDDFLKDMTDMGYNITEIKNLIK